MDAETEKKLQDLTNQIRIQYIPFRNGSLIYTFSEVSRLDAIGKERIKLTEEVCSALGINSKDKDLAEIYSLVAQSIEKEHPEIAKDLQKFSTWIKNNDLSYITQGSYMATASVKKGCEAVKIWWNSLG